MEIASLCWIFIILSSSKVTSQPTTTITVGSGPPVDITATPTINQSVELQCSRTGAPKQWYSTGSRVKATPGEVWTTGGHTRKLGFSTFATSHAGTYSCRVRNNNEEIKTTYTVVLATTPPPPPPQVQDVTITRGISDESVSLRVSWTVVSGSGITYTVWYSTNNGTTTQPPSGALNVSGITGTSTTLSRLAQGTTYYIWVSAVSSGVPGTYSMRMSETTYSEPSAPVNVTVIQMTCSSVNIAWSPPANTGGLPIDGYIVFYEEDGRQVNITTNMLFVIISELKSLPTTFKLVTMNAIGYTNENESETVKLKESELKVVSTNSTTLKISYNDVIPLERYECEVYDDNLTTTTINITADKEVIVGSLQPNTSYLIWCTGYNGSTEGCLDITTKSQVPNVIQNLKTAKASVPENSSNIVQGLLWDTPNNEKHDQPEVYVVRTCKEITTNCTILETKGNHTEYNLTLPLSPLMKYSVSVAGKSRNNTGPFSDSITLDYKPAAPVEISDAMITCQSIEVQWNQSKSSGDLPILMYNIAVRNQSTFVTEENTTSTVIGNLLPLTSYTIQVRSINAATSSEATEINITTTERDMAEANVKPLNSSSINIVISKNHTMLLNPQYFQCHLNNNITVNISATEDKVSGLSSNTTYSIHCIGYNGSREVCLEFNSSDTTKFEVPERVNNVTKGTTVTTENSINQTLYWSEPSTSENDAPKYYTIYYSSSNGITLEKNTTGLVYTLVFPPKNETYNVSVAGRSGQHIGPRSDHITLVYKEPPVPLEVIITGKACDVYISWKPPTDIGDLPITGYVIEHSTTSIKLNTTTLNVSISQLIPKTKYTFRVKAVNALGESFVAMNYTTEEKNIGTLQIDPYFPKGITINKSSEHYRYNCTISSFNNIEITISFTQQDHTEQDSLESDTTYIVHCIAYDRNGSEACFEANGTVKTLPGKITEVNINQTEVMNNKTKQSFTWISPNSSANYSYVIKYGNAANVTSPNGTSVMTKSITVTNINRIYTKKVGFTVPTSRVSYNFWIAAISDAGIGEYSDRVNITYDVPEAPDSVSLSNITCNSITVYWNITKQFIGRLPHTGYTVRYRSEESESISLNVSNQNRQIMISNLAVNTVYTIEVSANNSIGEGKVTKRNDTTKMRDNVTIETAAVSPQEVNLTLYYEERINFNCSITQHHPKKEITIVYYNTTLLINNQTIPDLDLHPYTTYIIECIDGTGDLCLEAMANVTTEEDKPSGTPQNLMQNATASTSFTVTWGNPLDNETNGIIVGFTVQLYGNGSHSYEVNTSSAIHIYEATNLESNKVYTVNVSAYTRIGVGPAATINITTIPKVQEFTATHVSNSSITVEWDVPTDTYTVWLASTTTDSHDYGNKGSEPLNVTGRNSHTLTGLDAYREYKIEIYQGNDLGNGSKISTTNRTLSAKPSGTPQDLTLVGLGSHSYTINWTEPRINETNGKIEGFTVSYVTKYGNVSMFNETSKVLCVKGLYSGETYTVNVSAYTDVGNGPAATIDVTTIPLVKDLSVSNLTSSSITVHWSGIANDYTVWLASTTTDSHDYGNKGSGPLNVTGRNYFTLTSLDAYREYEIEIYQGNDLGNGSKINTTNRTLSAKPSGTPQDLTLVGLGSHSYTINWTEPRINETNGKIEGFTVSYVTKYGNVSMFNETSEVLCVKDLYPGETYTVNVSAYTDVGNGPAATIDVTTIPLVKDLSVSNLSSSSITVHWSGIANDYTVWLASTTTDSHDYGNKGSGPLNVTGRNNYTLTGLDAYREYEIQAYYGNTFGNGSISNITTQTQSAIPTEAPRNLTTSNETPSSVILMWVSPDVSGINGKLLKYIIKIKNHSYEWNITQQANNIEGRRRRETQADYNVHVNHLTPYTQYNWNIAAVNDRGIGPFVGNTFRTDEDNPIVSVKNVRVEWLNDSAVNVTWDPLTFDEARGYPNYRITLEEASFDNFTNNTFIIISDLDPNTEYKLTVQPYSGNNQNPGPDSVPYTFRRYPEVSATGVQMWLIAVILVVLIALVVCCVIVVICTYCQLKKKQKKYFFATEEVELKENLHASSPISQKELLRKDPISKHVFAMHVREMHKERDKKFKDEYQSVTTSEGRTTASELNPLKNRYVNIHTFDHSRVPLREPDDEGNDYINASYINGYAVQRAYIASQGPKPDTVSDFWQMIWEQRSTIIIMLTKLVEKTRTKCAQYWEDEINGVHKPGRNLEIMTVKHEVFPEYDLRTFRVRKKGSVEPLEVKHFLYTAWPDHGVPKLSSAIVRFIRQQIRPAYGDSTAPMVVHCSAGAGRTGTLITIDVMLQKLQNGETELDIFNFVQDMRTRRTFMVQNVSQYIYIHDSLNDYISVGDTSISANSLRMKINGLSYVDNENDVTGFAKQYSQLENVCLVPDDEDFEFSKQVSSKNRYLDKVPYFDNYLATVEDDEDPAYYYNATKLVGYGEKEYIAAQTPVKSSEVDVLTIITMYKCPTIVVLSNFIERQMVMCTEFWPKDESKTHHYIDNFDVQLKTKVKQSGYTTYQLEINQLNLDYECPALETTLYHYTAWPKNGHPNISSLLTLMGDVENSQFRKDYPMMVMCDDGMSRTGIFLCAMSEIERMKVEGMMDIFQRVKSLRASRPHMVSSAVDYEVCHEVVLSYLESFDTYANFK